MYFDKQEFTVMHKYPAYYASIMLNAFRRLLCSLLCQHNRRVPSYSRQNECFSSVRHAASTMFSTMYKVL